MGFSEALQSDDPLVRFITLILTTVNNNYMFNIFIYRFLPHLKRLMSSYLLYYHEDRTHLGLAKDTPAGRPAEIHSAREDRIQSLPRLGWLHHRYAVAA